LGNNIANVNTVGFKGASFDAMLGSAMGTNGSSQSSGIIQNFSQGNITSSNNPLDIAISGAGFFKLSIPKIENGKSIQSERFVFSRDGQFSLNKDGQIVNSSGNILMGKGDQEIKIDVGGSSEKKTTTTINLGLTLDSRVSPIPSSISFNSTDPTTYTNSTTTPIYGDNGELKNIQTFYVKRSDTSWDVYYAVGGKTVNQEVPAPTEANPNGKRIDNVKTTLNFDASGNIILPIAPNDITQSIPMSVDGNGLKNSESNIAVNLTNLSKLQQVGSSFSATMNQDGYPSGQMTGYKVGVNGVITVQYSNGQTDTKGPIELVTFNNPQGLEAGENNQWTKTTASGEPQARTPGDKCGILKGSSTEDSNVDLTVEMIKLISAQRAFQSAAEVIKKQDEILQGVVHIGQ
jgi:flagellar hook protein FlgE